MKKKKIEMTFNVVTSFDDLVDEETFRKEYKGNILKLCKWMFKNEGLWWDDEMKLVDAKII